LLIYELSSWRGYGKDKKYGFCKSIILLFRDRGMKGNICYIMQDDCLLPHLTVMESMMVRDVTFI